MKNKNQNPTIKCPKCDTNLKVDQLLVTQFEKSIRADLEFELSEREEDLKQQRLQNKRLADILADEKSNIENEVAQKVKDKIRAQEESLRSKIRDEVEQERSAELELLEGELQKKSSQLKDLHRTKAKLRKLSIEFEEKEAEIHLRKEAELAERLEKAKLSMKENMQLESTLALKEKENIIESLKSKLEEARQRVSQGSMQMQGEAQELVLEAILDETHPQDSIEEVKKGANGADCVQTIITNTGRVAGKIVYESKNTKNWSDNFITKLKQDNLQTKAEIMVIVTKTMPKGVEEKFALIDGVWVTTMHDVRDLSLLLRFGLLKTHAVMISQSGRKDKMGVLYDYLTSTDFKHTFESILEGFKNLQDLHNEEQRKMQLVWKKRAKHLELVLSSTIEFYGSIKSISGNAIADIMMLEMKQAG